MISYLFNNSKRVNKNKLFNILKREFNLDYIEHNENSTILSNENILVDIDPKYISILLYDEKLNIKPIKKYLLERSYGKIK